MEFFFSHHHITKHQINNNFFPFFSFFLIFLCQVLFPYKPSLLLSHLSQLLRRFPNKTVFNSFDNLITLCILQSLLLLPLLAMSLLDLPPALRPSVQALASSTLVRTMVSAVIAPLILVP